MHVDQHAILLRGGVVVRVEEGVHRRAGHGHDLVEVLLEEEGHGEPREEGACQEEGAAGERHCGLWCGGGGGRGVESAKATVEDVTWRD